MAVEKINKNQRAKNHIFDLVLNLNSLDKNKKNIIQASSTSNMAFDPFNQNNDFGNQPLSFGSASGRVGFGAGGPPQQR